MQSKKNSKVSLPQVSYRRGKLIENVELYSVFVGRVWKEKENAVLSEKVNTFLSDIVTSDLIRQLKEYSVKKYSIGVGKLVGTTVVDRALGKEIDNKKIKQFLTEEIKHTTLISPTPNTLYMLFYPPGVTITLGKKKSCDYFCGYHDVIQNTIIYSVIPYPDCKPCRKDLSLFDAYTVIISHELCEAIVNPIGQTGWYDDTFAEIGDICVGKTKKLEKYMVQKEWSNKEHKCA